MMLEHLLDAVQFGVTLGVVGLFPGLGPLEGDVMSAQDLTEPFRADRHPPIVVVAEIAG